VTPEILEPGLERLRSWGLEVEVGEDVYDTQPPGYLAGTDEKRLARVEAALTDSATDAVVFSRGGYGTMRWLSKLEVETLDPPPVIAGFSDLTALHLCLAGCHSVATLHGPVVKSLRMHDRESRSSEAMQRAMFGEREPGWALEGMHTVLPGRVSGRLLGGNLTMVVHMLGSRFCPDLSDAILLLEETGESDYRLDRALTAIRLAPESRRPAGVVLGDFVECGGAYVSQSEAARFVEHLADDFGVPVVSRAPIGHEDPNIAVPMGLPVTLDAEKGKLTFHDTVTG
jgi:muramoyltetrapeptide carboxypeptidase